VSSSKEIVYCQLHTPCFSKNKNTKKLIQNTRKCCLLNATNVKFSKFSRLTPHFKIVLRAIFLRTQPKKMPYHSQVFARKPDQDPRDVTSCRIGMFLPSPNFNKNLVEFINCRTYPLETSGCRTRLIHEPSGKHPKCRLVAKKRRLPGVK